MLYEDILKDLAPLETFESRAFVGDPNTPQEVCDFVLALAVAYNDLRDALSAVLLLDEVGPKDVENVTPARGEFGGLRTTVLRFQAGSIHELIDLLRKNPGPLSHPTFVRLEGSLSAEGRAAWRTLKDIAANKPTATSLAKTLLFIRNKVGFHYDPEQIGRGYRAQFSSASGSEEPLLSRGGTLKATRFYFADAATLRYMRDQASDEAAQDFLRSHGQLLNDVNQALNEIVTKFVNLRGFAWRQYRPRA